MAKLNKKALLLLLIFISSNLTPVLSAGFNYSNLCNTVKTVCNDVLQQAGEKSKAVYGFAIKNGHKGFVACKSGLDYCIKDPKHQERILYVAMGCLLGSYLLTKIVKRIKANNKVSKTRRARPVQN